MKPFKKLLITAGPTREMLDPVRFISNVSTGEMGYSLAKEALAAGYAVTLVSGPTALKPPKGVRFVSVLSAAEMKKACEKYFPKQDALIMTAAVCDFTAAKTSAQKISRTKTREFYLMQTPDILAGLGKKKGKRLLVGFCLETEHWLENAKKKLHRKNLDGIVANFYSKSHIPFGNRKITTAFVDRDEQTRLLRQKTKKQVAFALLKWMETLRKN